MKGNLLLMIAVVVATLSPAATLAKEPPNPAIPDGFVNISSDTKCILKPETGPCKALFKRYYFNPKHGECASFIWGGCGGVVPFETLEECKKTCEAPETLRITELRSLHDDLYAVVSLEFPKRWNISGFRVLVDGKEVNARRQSGGYSSDRQMESLLFFPGRPGVKHISVLAEVEGKTAETSGSLNWNPRPFVALLDYVGDRMIATGEKKIRLVTANTEDVAVKFNGELTKPQKMGVDAILLSIEPLWRPGLNTVSFEGKGVDGPPIRKSYTFVNLDGGIRQRETVLLDFGCEGSKSGPFFSISIEGEALSAGKDSTVDSYVLDSEGWVGRETRLVRELKAVKAGTAKVKIFEKPHFLQQKRLKKEIVLTVLPDGK